MVLEGEAETPRPAAPQRGTALTLGLILLKAEVFSIFDCILSNFIHLWFLMQDKYLLKAFLGVGSARGVKLQGCNSRTHQGQV